MKSAEVDWSQIIASLGALHEEIARLSERVAALESAALPAAPVAAAPQVSAPEPVPVVEEGLSEELVLVISAAIAAFLGKKAAIRQIRLLGSAAWAQQGRVTIQASHSLALQR
jgi:methylmalonyl-CoA carboxyltransferase large subunit